MESNRMGNKKLISFLGTLINIIWWVALPAFSLIFLVVLYKLFIVGNVDWQIPVNIPPNDFDFSITPNKEAYRFIAISEIEGKLLFNVVLTPLLIFVALVVVLSTFYLFLSIVYNLRKIFRSLRAGEPFAYVNFSNLRQIGLFVLLFALVDFGLSLFNRYLLQQHFLDHGKNYTAKLSFGFDVILIGLVILVLAEIFRHGYKLKTENESFI